MAGSSKLKGHKGDIVKKNKTMVPHYHILLHTIFGKRLMTYDEYLGYSVLCEATFMGK